MAPSKQMGPALLPTPLSPARGRCGLARVSAGRPSCLSSSALGARCPCRVRLCVPAFAILHRLASRFVTGARTGIRSCFPTRLPSPRRSAPCGCQALGKTETVTLLAGGSNTPVRDYENPSLQLTPAGIAAFTDDAASRFPQTSSLAFGRNLMQSLSQAARGQSPPHLRHKNPLKFMTLRCAFPIVCVPKTVRNCARIRVWARSTRASFPLLPASPVDGSGQVNRSSHLASRLSSRVASRGSAIFNPKNMTLQIL